jgi:hypothetical protein
MRGIDDSKYYRVEGKNDGQNKNNLNKLRKSSRIKNTKQKDILS